MQGAGITFITPDGLALFVKRASGSDHAGTWAWPGGGVENGETPEEAAKREALEEIGFEAKGPLEEIHNEEVGEISFTTFLNGVDDSFVPKLNGEHTAYAWAPLIDPPSPLHPGVQSMLDDMDEIDMAELGMTARLATDMVLAMDRASFAYIRAHKENMAFDKASVRHEDADGRLHLAMTNISKANVCPYLGKEIPNWQTLGLDANKIYHLYRDPEELARAAPTFNNLPVLNEHVEVTAADHKPDLIIGTTGTDAQFEHPFLRNSMSFWTDGAKDDIESERKKELSSAYRYRADMTPGTSPEGDKFDGVMRDIVGNHVALVEEGRAGPDVVVGDSTEELNKMGKVKISQKATMARGALATYLQPRLAKDAKMPSLTKLLLGLDAKNFAAKKPGLIAALTPLLAKDGAEGLKALMNALETTPVQDDMDPSDDMVLDAPAPEGSGESDDPGVVPVAKPDPMEAMMAFLEGKLSPEDMAQLKQLCGQGEGDNPITGDDPPDFKGMPKPGGEMVGDSEEQSNVEDKPLTKAAMDAALEKARKETLEAANKAHQEIRAAERAVHPYVGEVTKAFDSAAGVYKSALEALKVDITGVDPSAYPAMLKLIPVPGSKAPTFSEAQLGMDAAATADFSKRFANASRIRNI